MHSRSAMPGALRGHETLDMEAGKVVIAIGDSSLARVLKLWLSDALPGRFIVAGNIAEVAPGDVALVTPGDCEPAAAAELTARGAHPIVLAPVPRAIEGERYRKAGAQYLLMSIENAGALVSAVIDAARHYSPPADLRPIASQFVSPNFSAW